MIGMHSHGQMLHPTLSWIAPVIVVNLLYATLANDCRIRAGQRAESVNQPAWSISDLASAPVTAAKVGDTSTRFCGRFKGLPPVVGCGHRLPQEHPGRQVARYGTERAYRCLIAACLDGTTPTTVADRSANRAKGTTFGTLSASALFARPRGGRCEPSGTAVSANEIMPISEWRVTHVRSLVVPPDDGYPSRRLKNRVSQPMHCVTGGD